MNTSQWISSSDDSDDREWKVTSASPLFPVALGLIGGILLDDNFVFPLWMYLCLLLLATIFCFSKTVRRRSTFLLVTLASVGVGGVLHLQTVRVMDPNSVGSFASTEGKIVNLHGTIASKPELKSPAETPFARWSFQKDRSVFLLDVESIEEGGRSFEATGLLRVTVFEPVLDLELHDRVSISGRLFRLRPPGNPGEFDWSDYYRRMGVVASLSCPHRENIQSLSVNDSVRATMESGWMQRSLIKIRRHVGGLLTYDVVSGGDEPSSLADAMILGQRSKLQRRINEVFFRAGCMHFLAVSGLHLAIPMSFVWILGRLFSIPKRKCAILLMLTVLMYLVIAEPRPSILRASLMGFLFAISILIGRSRSSLNFLSAAAIVLLLFSPVMVFDLGFQLSFLSVLGIIYLSVSFRQMWTVFSNWVNQDLLKIKLIDQVEKIDDRGVDERELNDVVNTMGVGWTYRWYRIRHVLVRFFVFPIMVGLGAWLATLPIVVFQFNFLHIWSPINSVLVSPFVYLFVLCGFAKIGIGMLYPGAESVLELPMQWLDTTMIRLVDFLGSLPGSSISITSPPWWWIVAYYAVLILFACRFRRPVYTKTIRQDSRVFSSPVVSRLIWLNRSFVAVLLIFIVSTAVWSMPRRVTGRLTVTVLAVGSGSATVIELPDGRVMMYDAGSLHWPAIGRSTVIPFLRQRGIHRIDRVYLGHANLDHYNGLIDVVEAIPTDSVVLNEYFLRKNRNKRPVRFLMDQLRDRGINIETIESARRKWNEGEVTIEHLWPVGDFDASLSNNNTSSVLRLTYKNHSILFTGDIEDRAQRGLLAHGELHADVLVLPHHGSIRSSTESFITTVGAKIAIRSSHDRSEAWGQRNGIAEIVGPAAYYNTAEVGAVTITIDSQGLHACVFHATNGVH